MDENSKTVLIVSYDWLPSAEIGAVRPGKIARYIAYQGWTPIILTVKESSYERIFKEKETSAFTILRTSSVPSPLKAYGYTKKIIGKLRQSRRFLKKDQRAPSQQESSRSRSPLAYAKRLILSMLYMPDEFQGWLPIAILKGCSVIKTNNISHMITSGPPYTAHLIGLALKKWKGEQIKWIVDFRDPWVANEQRLELVTTAVSNYCNRFLEKQVILHADHVVCVTPSMTDWYRKRYPTVAGSVWITITNGFEREEFRRINHNTDQKKFIISYVGSIEYERSPEALLQSIAELCQEGAIDKQKVSIRFIGKCGSVQGRPTIELIREYRLEEVVELVGLVPRFEALRQMKDAHILLLLANAQRLQVPGKAYEYIAAGSFILAVTEEHSATADLVRRVGGGAIVPPDDYQMMKDVLRTRYEEFIKNPSRARNFESERSSPVLDDYDWNQLGSRYAAILN